MPGYGDPTVAEYALLLILALLRRLKPTLLRTERGEFSREGLRGPTSGGRPWG